jgi:2-polyprenyl-6-methoxyphenol hydroxylase-like FAD-dependent oxidoreductase
MQTARDACSSCRGFNILFNMQVVIVDLEKPAVHLKDGTVMEADLIIGADG